MNKHHERIPLTAHVLLPVKKVGNELRRVGDEKVEVLDHFKISTATTTEANEKMLAKLQY